MPRAPYQTDTFTLQAGEQLRVDVEWDYLFLRDGADAQLSYAEAKNMEFPKGTFFEVEEEISWERSPDGSVLAPIRRRKTAFGFILKNVGSVTRTYKMVWGHGNVDHRSLLFDEDEALPVEDVLPILNVFFSEKTRASHGASNLFISYPTGGFRLTRFEAEGTVGDEVVYMEQGGLRIAHIDFNHELTLSAGRDFHPPLEGTDPLSAIPQYEFVSGTGPITVRVFGESY